MTRFAHPQRGVALIASMLILIIITLLGLSSMRSAGLQERMSGNQYDRNVVLEAAEAALREAEAIAAAPLTVTATCSNGICPRPVAGMADRWSDPDFTGWRAATSTRPANEPRSVAAVHALPVRCTRSARTPSKTRWPSDSALRRNAAVVW